MTDIDSVELFTSGEVAALFRVDPKTVARWHKTGKLAEHGIEVLRTLGGQRRFVASTVRRYLAEGGGR